MSGPYKFLRRSDLHFLLDKHTLIISTPKYFAEEYRRMEVKDPQINDPNEASTFGIHDPIVNKDATEENRELLRKFGVFIPEGAKDFTFVGNKIVHTHPQCFIFSTTKGFFPDIKAALTAPPASYDACIKIRWTTQFWKYLMKAGMIGAKPMSEIFKGYAFRRVTYEPITYKVGAEGQLSAHPFRKDVSFSNQNEWRAVFYPLQPIAEDRLIIQLDDDLNNFIVERSLN